MSTVFNVEKMMCGGCEANVKKVLAEAGIDAVTVDLEAKTVTIDGSIDVAAVATTITDAGYPATPA